MFSVTNPETHVFNLKRPVRTVALEPNFAKSSTRSLISGGMAGNLILHEKGWLGYKETVLHSGEGPIWQVRWRDNLIAWANDLVRFLPGLVCHCFLTPHTQYTGREDL